MHGVRRWVAALSCAFASTFAGSCGGGPEGPPTERLESLEYTLEPGQEEYYCYSWNLPADRETIIHAFRPDYGDATHHIFFGYTLAPDPDGFYDCPQLARTTWVPLFLGGANTSDLELPEGAAVRLPPGTQVFMQLHLQNATSETITARTAMDLEMGTAESARMSAGVFGLDDRTVSLPARARDVRSTMQCMPGRDMDVFAVLGHMHTYGSRLEVWRGEADTGSLLFDQAWTFADQPTTPVGFHIGADDMVTLRCTHDNPSDVLVPYGESSTQEMCSFIFYYTPFDFVDGCIQGGE